MKEKGREDEAGRGWEDERKVEGERDCEICVGSSFKPAALSLYRTSKSEILLSLTVIDSLALTVASRGLQLYKCLFCSAVLMKGLLYPTKDL